MPVNTIIKKKNAIQKILIAEVFSLFSFILIYRCLQNESIISDARAGCIIFSVCANLRRRKFAQFLSYSDWLICGIFRKGLS